MKGERFQKIEWIHGSQCVVRVEVEAVHPDDSPDDSYFDSATIRHLEMLQSLANAGNVDELAKHGTVFVRRSA